MACLPASVSALTPANAAFLEASLAALRRPQCVIQAADNFACREMAGLALQGKVPVIDAAAAIDRANAWNQIRYFQRGLTDEGGRPVNALERVETYSLDEAVRRLGDRHGVFQNVLAACPRADLEVTEVRLKPDTGGVYDPARRLMNANSTLKSGLAAGLFESVIHPDQSNVWRYLPLQVELGIMMMRGGEHPIGVQLTAAESTFDEVRDLLAQAEPRRPLCVPCPDFRGGAYDAGGYLQALEVFDVHGMIRDAYRMTRHDLSHISVFNQKPAERPREAVLQYDALEEAVDIRLPLSPLHSEEIRAEAFDETKPGPHLGKVLDELRDWLLSGYFDHNESLEHVKKRLLDEFGAMAPHASVAAGLIIFYEKCLWGRIRAIRSSGSST
ncbi:MAG TPA: hypothetical protein VLJ37_04755 [bacterium]|nr:hypothetical protein [bacterium]